MAKPDPIVESMPIARLTTVEWECPFCGNANGIPEITVCGCGAVRDGSRVRGGHVVYGMSPASAPITATDTEPPADPGK